MRALSFGILLLASGAARAGVVMEMTDRDLTAPDSKPGVQKLYFEGGRFRVDSVEAGRLDTSVIFRDRTMYAIDHGEKKYTVMDQAGMDRAAAQLTEMRREMEAQMSTLPPEQRAMVEKMLEGQGMPSDKPAAPRTRSVKDSGRTDTVSGRTCRVWEITDGGLKQEELCVVAPGSLPGGDELMKSMRDMAEMSRGFFEKIGAGEDAMDDVWSDLEKVNGIPILTREFEYGKAVAESRLSALEEKTLGASMFEVPAGFREEKLDMTGGS